MGDLRTPIWNPQEFLSAERAHGFSGVGDVVSFYRATPARHKGDFAPFSLLPVIYDGSAVERMNRISVGLSGIVGKVLERFVISSGFRSLFRLQPELLSFLDDAIESLVRVGRSPSDIADDAKAFLRFDAVLGGTSESKAIGVCEMNSNALGGLAESYFTGKALRRFSQFDRFAESSGLADLGAEIYDRWASAAIARCKSAEDFWNRALSSCRKPHFSFVVLFDSGNSDAEELAWFERFFSAEGMEFSVVDARQLEIGSDGCLRSRNPLYGASGIPIDFAFNYLIWSDLVRHRDDCSVFLGNVFSMKTDLFPNPLCYLIQDKSFLASIRSMREDDASQALSKADISFLKEIVPNTFLVSDENRFVLSRHKDSYVIKPSSLYGGSGVLFGADVIREEWEGLISAACSAGSAEYVAQRRMRCDKIDIIPIRAENFKSGEFPMLEITKANSVIGIFSIGSDFSGAYVRAGISNVVSGADSACACAAFAWGCDGGRLDSSGGGGL